MKKINKSILCLLLQLCMIISVLSNTVFAFDLNESSKVEIQEQFQYATNSLKNGDFETIIKYISVKNPINDNIKSFAKYIPYSEIVGDVIKNIDGNDKDYIRAYFKEIFKKYNFTLKDIKKTDINKYLIKVEIQMPNDDYYTVLEEAYKEPQKLEKGIDTISGYLAGLGGLITGIGGYFFKGRTTGKFISELYFKAFSILNEYDFDTKKIEKEIYIENVNDRYVWEIDLTQNYDWLEGKYTGNDNNDKNLINYLFIPIWTLIQDYYKGL